MATVRSFRKAKNELNCQEKRKKMKWINKIEVWFSGLEFKWQIAIAMAVMFLVMVGIIAAAG